MKRRLMLALLATPLAAAPITLQPLEADSKDVFAYKYIPATNFETYSPGFQRLLAAANTDIGPDYAGSSAHDLEAFIRFDLSGVSLDAGDRAMLRLYAVDAAKLFQGSPTPAQPVPVLIGKVDSTWAEDTLTWNSRPGATTVVTSEINGINQWFSFDVTSLVQDWITTPGSNYGFRLAGSPSGGVEIGGKPGAAVFASSSDLTGHMPILEVVAVPEPSMVAFGALAALLGRRRR